MRRRTRMKMRTRMMTTRMMRMRKKTRRIQGMMSQRLMERLLLPLPLLVMTNLTLAPRRPLRNLDSSSNSVMVRKLTLLWSLLVLPPMLTHPPPPLCDSMQRIEVGAPDRYSN